MGMDYRLTGGITRRDTIPSPIQYVSQKVKCKPYRPCKNTVHPSTPDGQTQPSS